MNLKNSVVTFFSDNLDH